MILQVRKNKIYIMKLRILSLLLSCIIIFFVTPSFINANSSGCGDSSSTTSNKCCSSLLIANSDDVNVDRNIVGAGFDFLFSFINDTLNRIMSPVNKVIYDITGKAIKPCNIGVPSTPNNPQSSACICIDDSNSLSSIDYLCDTIKTSDERDKCSACLSGGGIWSGIGCVKSDMKSFIQDTVFRIGIGLAGGISFLCILFSAFQMQTSGGNAEKLKKAQELLTNCITGLMVIIFSVLILKIIGVDILRIPGFS